jgi:hypothetical protein
MQEEFECYFMVADLHSLTTHPDTKELRPNVERVLAENIACGLDPDKVALYCQSHVHETAELYLYLNMLAYKGELEKTVTFKDKVRQHPENVNAGLLTYLISFYTGPNMCLWVKTRSSIWKWPETMSTVSITVTGKFFRNPLRLITVPNWLKYPVWMVVVK